MARATRWGNNKAADLHNQIRRAGGNSTITGEGGVKITINKDNRHLQGTTLQTEHKAQMNLMYYDFNNPSMIPEEVVSNGRSQTTDRGPSRKHRSRGRLQSRGRLEVATAGNGPPGMFAGPEDF